MTFIDKYIFYYAAWAIGVLNGITIVFFVDWLVDRFQRGER